MALKKEPVEISCSECSSRFRLWIPSEVLPEWEKGAPISCVKCGARHLVKKSSKGFAATLIKERAFEEEAAPAVRSNPPRAVPEAPAADEAEEAKEAEEAEEAPQIETVLLIEDEKLAREMVGKTLKDTGIRLLTARTGEEALKLLKKEQVNLIVTDLYLKTPGDSESKLDGEELLNKIASLGMNIPAIITTGKYIVDDLVLDPKWFDLHVRGFIQKGNPFWVDELKLKIKEVMYKD